MIKSSVLLALLSAASIHAQASTTAMTRASIGSESFCQGVAATNHGPDPARITCADWNGVQVYTSQLPSLGWSIVRRVPREYEGIYGRTVVNDMVIKKVR